MEFSIYLPWYLYICPMKIEEVLQTEFKSPHLKAVINVKYTSNFILTVSTKFMEQFGLSMPQFNILRILRGAGEELAVSVVKERMIEKSPNTTRLMDKLIDKELICRRRCKDDRRIVFVKISAKGEKLLTQIDKAMDTDHLFPVNLSDEEALLLSDLLDKMRGK